LRHGLSDWFWLAVCIAAATYYAVFAWRIVSTALRTGRLQARGVVYDRSKQPGRYWLLTIAAASLSVIFLGTVIFYASAFFRTDN